MFHTTIELVHRVNREIRHATGRTYSIDFTLLDQHGLQEMLRLLRDLDYDKRAAANKARMMPWRR